MRAAPPRADTRLFATHLEHASGVHRIAGSAGADHEADPDLVASILDSAARFAEDVLVPLNDAMDRHGVQIVNGRLQTAPGHREAWASFIADGWTTLDQPTEYGGQGLPLSLALAVQELIDRACPAFGMLVVLQRAAARLVAAWGDASTCDRYLPGMIAGEIGATICISEPGAGSDVAQIRSRATKNEDGTWRISGEKCWISYGDHDLTDRIVHCVLARTGGDAAQPEIGLFMVEGAASQGDAVQLLRAEEKMGLHGSPTCVLAFDRAHATLLGDPARGLAQMFVMITQMRLAVGAMGLGIAASATDIAIGYALERRQGGKPGAPVVIASHVDIQRQLTEMVARTELLRGLLYACANYADTAEDTSTDAEERGCAGALLQFLLPIAKTCGADAAHLNGNSAIQVLGGAGYTREWPVEQAVRDARILSIFEGTSGIQALDIVHRRVRRNSGGFLAFLDLARSERNERLEPCLAELESAASYLCDPTVSSYDVDAGASAFLDLATLAVSGWIAARFESPHAQATLRMRIAARYMLADISDRAAALASLVKAGASRLATHDDLIAVFAG